MVHMWFIPDLDVLSGPSTSTPSYLRPLDGAQSDILHVGLQSLQPNATVTCHVHYKAYGITRRYE